MRKRKPGQPVGGDIDWFVIPIEKIRQWAVVIAAGPDRRRVLGYFVYIAQPPLAGGARPGRDRQGARRSGRAAGRSASRGPGRISRRRATSCATRRRRSRGASWDEAFRLAVESQSYSRRALGGSGAEESGGRVLHLRRGRSLGAAAGRSTFEPARQRQALFDGDFVKTGKTGSAEIMFSDGTLYTIRPGSLFECRAPGLVGGGRQPGQDGLGRGQRLHLKLHLDGRDRRRDGGDRQGVPRVGSTWRRATRPRSRASAAGRRCRRARRRWSSGTARRSRPPAASGAISRRRSSCPSRRSRSLPADNRIYDLKTGDQIELKWSDGAEAVRYRLQISRSRLFVPDATEVDLDDRPDHGPREGLTRRLLLLARRRDQRRTALTSDWSLVRRFKMLTEPPRPGRAPRRRRS